MLEIQIPKHITPLILIPSNFDKYQQLIIKGKLGQYNLKVKINDLNIKDTQDNIQIPTNSTKKYKKLTNLLLYDNTSEDNLNFLNYNKKHFFFVKTDKENETCYNIKDTKFRWFNDNNNNNDWPKNYKEISNKTKIQTNSLKLFIGYLLLSLDNTINVKNNENFGEVKSNEIKKDNKNNSYNTLMQELKAFFIGILQGYTINIELRGLGYSCVVNNTNKENIVKNSMNNSNNIYRNNYKKLNYLRTMEESNNQEFNKNSKNIASKVNNKFLKLNLGLSHSIEYRIPQKDVIITCSASNKQSNVTNKMTLFGISNLIINQIGANIYKLKKPEPYKGKGIRYHNEKLFLKEKKKK